MCAEGLSSPGRVSKYSIESEALGWASGGRVVASGGRGVPCKQIYIEKKNDECKRSPRFFLKILCYEVFVKQKKRKRSDDDVFYLFLQQQKRGAELHIHEEGTYHKRLFRGPNTNDMKK